MNSLRNILAVTAAALFSAAATTSAQNLLGNGGFETGDFTGWDLNDPSNNTEVGTNGPNFVFAAEGTRYAYLATELQPAVGSISSLSQTFNTQIGQAYTFSFALANDQTAPAGVETFQAFFNDVALTLTLPPPNTGYQTFTFSDLIATSNLTEIRFDYRHDDDGFRLDAVSVVPEPSTVSLIAMSAFGGLLFVYRRTRRAASTSQV